jgi:hypothetical protein
MRDGVPFMLVRVSMLRFRVPFRLARVRITVFIQDPSGHAIADRLSKHVVSETSQVPRYLTQSRRRCGQGEPSPGADVGVVSPVPVQMWQEASAVPAQTWQTTFQPAARRTTFTKHHAPCSRERAGPAGAEARDDRQHDSCYAPHRPQRRKLSLAHRTSCGPQHTHTRAHPRAHAHAR